MVNDLLSMAAAGSAVFLLWQALYPLTRERFPARWHYCALKASLFFLLFPIRPCLRLLERLAIPAPSAGISPAEPLSPGAVLPAAVTPSVGTVPQLYPDAPSFSLTVEAMKLLAVLWAIGAAALLTYKLTTYIRFRHRLLRCCVGRVSPESEAVFRACQTELGIRGRVRLLCAPHIQTPLVIGLLRPTVILPGNDFSGEELRYIFLHELTHVKHHDLWIRAAALAALDIHWYNPVAYLLARHIQTISEQSCDEWVACSLTHRERYAYGKTILKVAADMTAGAAELAVPMSMRRSLERRLMHMLHPKFTNTKTKLLACAAAVILLACGATAALAASVSVQSEDPKPASIQNSAESERESAAIHNTEKTADDPDSSETAVPSGAGTASDLENIPAIHASAPDEKNNTGGNPQQAAARQPSVSKEVIDNEDDATAMETDTATPMLENRWGVPDGDIPQYTEFVVNDFEDAHELGKYLETTHGLYPGDYVPGRIDGTRYIVQITYKERAIRERLPDGVYPVNSKGNTYGTAMDYIVVGYDPDLIQVQATNGESGYVFNHDLRWGGYPDEMHNPEDKIAYMEWRKTQPDTIFLPVYDVNCDNIIGYFGIDNCDGHLSGGMTIDEAKEALANGDI